MRFDQLFDEVFASALSERATTRYRGVLTEAQEKADIGTEKLPVGPQDEYRIQKKIRPFFNKEGVNDSVIGIPPEFKELGDADGRMIQHHACSFFVDIRGSTRLSLLYRLEDVVQFKNAVLQSCVEVIRSFDGHVHRFMGDAVMAFFFGGGDAAGKENAVADAVNCMVTLRAMLEEGIQPWMDRQGFDSSDFGFRVGCDFGNTDQVLWANFGYPGVNEITATGLTVDMASKLQSKAPKNEGMLGQTLLDFVDWPEEYVQKKTEQKNGETITIPIVRPNITDRYGEPLNYRMRVLDYSQCMTISPLPTSFRQGLTGSAVLHNPNIEYHCYTVEAGHRYRYASTSRFLDKGVDLEFEVRANTRGSNLAFPLTVRFTKTNHGTEAAQDGKAKEFEPKTDTMRREPISKYDRAPAAFATATCSDGTAYRGLHTMRCEVFDSNGYSVFRDSVGVLIR